MDASNAYYNPGQNYVGQACRMHCLDHRSVFRMETNVLWAQSYFPPPPPPPLPPCNVVRKEKLADDSSNIASGGKGGASEYCSNSGKRHFVPHILARIVDNSTWPWFRINPSTPKSEQFQTSLQPHQKYYMTQYEQLGLS